jgi:hypothetical protein
MDLPALRSAYRRRRHEIFFWSLIAVLAALALSIPEPAIHVLFIVAIFGTLDPGPRRRTLFALFAMAWAVRIAAPGASLALASLVFLAALGITLTVIVLRDALRAPVVGREHLFGSLAGYLLLGLVCGQLYWVMEQQVPHSFALPPDGGAFALVDGVYFSFVTLTTVGYGDIAPRTGLARGLANLEAVGGQLYLAVLVARLIGLYTSRKGAGPS